MQAERSNSSRSAGVQDDRRGGCRVDLAVLAGHLGVIVDDEGALDGIGSILCGHIRCAVPICVDAGDIGTGHGNGAALLIRQLLVRAVGGDGEHPGVGTAVVGPLLVLVVGQVQRVLDLLLGLFISSSATSAVSEDSVEADSVLCADSVLPVSVFSDLAVLPESDWAQPDSTPAPILMHSSSVTALFLILCDSFLKRIALLVFHYCREPLKEP